jgi:hypothetical protein
MPSEFPGSTVGWFNVRLMEVKRDRAGSGRRNQWVERTDGRHHVMTGTDRTELAPGDIFVIETLSGAVTVPQRGDTRGPTRGPARVKEWQEKQKSNARELTAAPFPGLDLRRLYGHHRFPHWQPPICRAS